MKHQQSNISILSETGVGGCQTSVFYRKQGDEAVKHHILSEAGVGGSQTSTFYHKQGVGGRQTSTF